jgi:hypothetical protein
MVSFGSFLFLVAAAKTSKGVGIAAARKDVDRLYGRGKESRVYLEKGKNDRVGSLGDYVLEYRALRS